MERDQRRRLVVIGVLAYMILGQLTRHLPNPMIPEASLALNMMIPVVAGCLGGVWTGALVGFLGTLLNFLIKIPLYPAAGFDWYEAVAILPHMIMGAIAGVRTIKHRFYGTALSLVVGHGLNLTGFMLADLLPPAILQDTSFWSGLLTEMMVSLIFITLIIGLARYLRGEGPGFAWQYLGWRRYIFTVTANLVVLGLFIFAYRWGVSLAVYLLTLPVVLTALTLGILETWVLVSVLTLLLGVGILGNDVVNAESQIAFILTLNLVALTIGELVGSLQQQRDLARMRLEELRQTYTALAEGEKIREQMIQNVSHELRTPLSMVLGYIELLSSETWGALSPEQREATQVVRKNVRALSKIVEKITVLDQVRLGDITHHPISLDALAQILVESKAAWAQEHNCTLVLKRQGEMPPLLGDARCLGRAIEAFIDNGVKFSPEGSRVIIRTWVEKGRAYLSVTDNGIGISEEQQGRLFRHFYQLDGSTTRRFGGLGTGLALVKDTVQAHGGDVWVESKPAEGSTFGFWIPLLPFEQVDSRVPAFTVRPAIGGRASGQ